MIPADGSVYPAGSYERRLWAAVKVRTIRNDASWHKACDDKIALLILGHLIGIENDWYLRAVLDRAR